MVKTKVVLIVFFILVTFTVGCYNHTHKPNSADHAQKEEVYVQWYAFWGIMPVFDEFDAGQIAGTDKCVITTKFTPIDALWNCTLGGISSMTRRSIIVVK